MRQPAEGQLHQAVLHPHLRPAGPLSQDRARHGLQLHTGGLPAQFHAVQERLPAVRHTAGAARQAAVLPTAEAARLTAGAARQAEVRRTAEAVRHQAVQATVRARREADTAEAARQEADTAGAAHQDADRRHIDT